MTSKVRLWKASTQYQILENLGEGAYSRVYRAERFNSSLNLRQIIALKILKSKNAVEMWRNEFASLAKVRSPYCVQVFAFEDYKSVPALVLEYVEGLNLRDLVQYAVLSNEDCLEIMAQIRCGLADLKTSGLCHGDLSPKNVMVDSRGKIRLLDFGLANLKAGETLFTPGFAAPEIMNGGKPNESTDLYSYQAISEFISSYAERPHSVSQITEPKAQRQQNLAQTVCLALQKKKSLMDLKTKTVQAIKRIRQPLLKLKLTIVMLTFAFASSSQTPQFVPRNDGAMIRIRTQSWHHITLDGRVMGYAPLDLSNITPGDHKISWENANGKGLTHIRVSSGAGQIITERELHSN